MMMNEAAMVLKTARSILEQAIEPYLCEICWVYVKTGEAHQCDPEARAYAILSVTSPTFRDKKRRAKGYRV